MIKFAFLTLLAVLAWAAPAEAQQSGTANQVMATPCAATGRVGLRSLCTADLPATMTPTTLTTTQEADTPVALSGCNGSTATIDLSSGTSIRLHRERGRRYLRSVQSRLRQGQFFPLCG